ncbi:Oidioi.mRNA.OKI2018_I69.chr1.g3374.t1.cds [Oikopleura dioica]|uniref:Oidioi.mRNA.OKI2018_I69.chr1.g3374.t1.cds n=1 Tax=Oikopleura dioica TaxID=34765 RepID=A0ABN7T0R0_OIKDI|nr:Oidioi.mRNA.OKI2018_I69.chr1.g3374.t1.cds [Oikopleura dioica]
MESFADRLAREIIRDVKNDFGSASSSPAEQLAANHGSNSPNQNRSSFFSKFEQRPHKRLKGPQMGFPERKRRNDEDKEIDLLADRLTTEIIDYATSSDAPSKGRKKERRSRQDTDSEIDQMEIYSDSTQPASEYQKTVIKYQNSDGAFSEPAPVATSRRESLWEMKVPKNNSIWRMTDE